MHHERIRATEARGVGGNGKGSRNQRKREGRNIKKE